MYDDVIVQVLSLDCVCLYHSVVASDRTANIITVLKTT